MSKTRLQDEYNKAILECDFFIALFATKAGNYTKEEFEVAYNSFKAGNKPYHIFTYFKSVEINVLEMNLDDLKSLKELQQYIDSLGHFFTRYKSTEDLLRQIEHQLSKVILQTR